MAVVLDPTVGGTASNTYVTVLEADTYHDTVLYATDWTSATTATRDIVLVWATRLLDDGINWNGSKSSNVQSLRWPRAGVLDRDRNLIASDSIPDWLKNATAELARVLIGRNVTLDPDTAGFKKIELPGGIAFTIDKTDRVDTLPDSVLDMVGFYGDASDSSGGIGISTVIRA